MVFLKEPMQQLDGWLADVSVFGRHPFDGMQGVGKILLLFAAIGAVEWLTMARSSAARSSQSRNGIIEAARSLGLGRRHHFPPHDPTCPGP